MNYEFIYISTDNYELRYTSKEGISKILPFKRTIEMSKKLQSIHATARLQMYQELTAGGMTKNDLIIKNVNSDGTITYDETNYKEFEKQFFNVASAIIMNEVIELCFKTSINDLLADMGFDLNDSSDTTTHAVSMFSQKFTKVIIGKDDPQTATPSIANSESVPKNTSTI